MPTSSQALILTHVLDNRVNAHLKCHVPSIAPFPLSTVTFGGEKLGKCRTYLSRYGKDLPGTRLGDWNGDLDPVESRASREVVSHHPSSGRLTWQQRTAADFATRGGHPEVNLSGLDTGQCSRCHVSPVSEGCLRVGFSSPHCLSREDVRTSRTTASEETGGDSVNSGDSSPSPSPLRMEQDRNSASENNMRLSIRKLMDLGFRLSPFKGEDWPSSSLRRLHRDSSSKSSYGYYSNASKPSENTLSSYSKNFKRTELAPPAKLKSRAKRQVSSERVPTLVSDMAEALRKVRIIRHDQVPSVEKQKLAALQKKIVEFENEHGDEDESKGVMTDLGLSFDELVLLSTVESTPMAEVPSVASTVAKPKKYKPPVIRMRRELPPPDRSQLCFSLKNSNLSHIEVKTLLESRIGSEIASLRYDPVYMHLDRENAGENANLVIWVFRLKDESQILPILNRGLEIENQFLRVRYYDDVMREEHVAYRMLKEIEDEKQRKSLTKKKSKKKGSKQSLASRKKSSSSKKSGRATPTSEEEPSQVSQLYFHAKS